MPFQDHGGHVERLWREADERKDQRIAELEARIERDQEWLDRWQGVAAEKDLQLAAEKARADEYKEVAERIARHWAYPDWFFETDPPDAYVTPQAGARRIVKEYLKEIRDEREGDHSDG